MKRFLQLPGRAKRTGFTLVELVVVILVIGIIAAVASPRMFDTAGDARINSTMSSMSVLRDAIELYKAENGSYPGASDSGNGTAFKADIATFLRGPFPKSMVPSATGDSSVTVETDGTGCTVGGTSDWRYDKVDGTLIINKAGYETL